MHDSEALTRGSAAPVRAHPTMDVGVEVSPFPLENGFPGRGRQQTVRSGIGRTAAVGTQGTPGNTVVLWLNGNTIPLLLHDQHGINHVRVVWERTALRRLRHPAWKCSVACDKGSWALSEEKNPLPLPGLCYLSLQGLALSCCCHFARREVLMLTDSGRLRGGAVRGQRRHVSTPLKPFAPPLGGPRPLMGLPPPLVVAVTVASSLFCALLPPVWGDASASLRPVEFEVVGNASWCQSGLYAPMPNFYPNGRQDNVGAAPCIILSINRMVWFHTGTGGAANRIVGAAAGVVGCM